MLAPGLLAYAESPVETLGMELISAPLPEQRLRLHWRSSAKVLLLAILCRECGTMDGAETTEQMEEGDDLGGFSPADWHLLIAC